MSTLFFHYLDTLHRWGVVYKSSYIQGLSSEFGLSEQDAAILVGKWANTRGLQFVKGSATTHEVGRIENPPEDLIDYAE